MNTLFARLALSAAVSILALAAPALADTALPAPYVSRALDAVLLPIDDDVRMAFDLAADDAGVLVLATESGGVADANGIGAGDVLHMVGGQKVRAPIDVDTIVYYWIVDGITDFDFGVYRDGGFFEVIGTITEDSYWEVIEVASIETWSSWSHEASFSYEVYVAEYSETIVESYESSEALIEETVTSEEFTTEMSEEVTEEFSEEEVAEEEMEASDEDYAEEDEMSDEEMDEDDMAAEDDLIEDEEFAEADMAEEETADEEAAEDEGADDAGEEESDDAGDEAGDEGGEE